MNVKEMTLQDLESCFNLTSKIRDGIIIMARANNNINTPKVKNINVKYDMLYNEVMRRLDCLYEGKITEKKALNEEISH